MPKGKDRHSVRVRRKLDANDHDDQSPSVTAALEVGTLVRKPASRWHLMHRKILSDYAF
jgi:hypothetical protein